MRDPFDETTTDRRVTIAALVAFAIVAIGLALTRPTVFGTVMVIVAFFVMIMLHELGHFVMARRADMKVTEFFVGFGPRLWSFRRGETEYGVKAFPLGGYCRIVGMTNLEEVDPADEPRTYRAKGYAAKMGCILAGSTMHFIIALLLMAGVLAFHGDFAKASTTLSDVSGPAKAAGLKAGDRIVTIDGVKIRGWGDVSTVLRPKPGATVAFVVVRAGESRSISVKLAAHRPDETERVGYAGVAPRLFTPHRSPVQAVALAPVRTAQVGWIAVKGLGAMFSPTGIKHYLSNFGGNAPKPGSDASRSRFVSPIGFGRLANEAVAAGWVEAIGLLIEINVFVGMFNLVPLLPFDGGHAAIATYEAIASRVRRRRVRVDVNKLMPITVAVLAVLAFIFLSSLFLDIAHPFQNPF